MRRFLIVARYSFKGELGVACFFAVPDIPDAAAAAASTLRCFAGRSFASPSSGEACFAGTMTVERSVGSMSGLFLTRPPAFGSGGRVEGSTGTRRGFGFGLTFNDARFAGIV